MVTRKFKHSHLFQSTRYSVSDILPQRNLRNNSLSALGRANSPEIVFPDDSFVIQNTSENKNGLFRSASDFCTQEPLPSQKANQEEKHCYSGNAEIFHSDYQDILSKRV